MLYRDYRLFESSEAGSLIIKIFPPGSPEALPMFILSSPPEARVRAMGRAMALVDKAIGGGEWKPDNDDTRP